MQAVTRFPRTLGASHVALALDTLLNAVQFARGFNGNRALRRTLWEQGFMRDRQETPPELFFQEAHGLKLATWIASGCYVQWAPAIGDGIQPLSATLFGDGLGVAVGSGEEGVEALGAFSSSLAVRVRAGDVRPFDASTMAQLETRLIRISAAVVGDYLQLLQRPDPEAQRALRCKGAVVCAVINSFVNFTEPQLLRHLPAFYLQFAELVHCASPDVRLCLSRLLAQRVATLLPFRPAPLPAASAAAPATPPAAPAKDT